MRNCKHELEKSLMKPLFNRLQKLQLRYRNPLADLDCFSNCKSVVFLNVISFKEQVHETISKCTFPKLEHLRFTYDDIGYHRIDLGNFFSRHKNLKTLFMVNIDSTSFLPAISDNCKHLEKLEIDVGKFSLKLEKAFNSLSTLSHLKELNIHCNDKNMSKCIKSLNSLNLLMRLELNNVSGDLEFIPALSKLKTLHALRLYLCAGPNNVNSLGELDKLRKLSIIHSTSEQDIDLVGMIKRLIHLKTLVGHLRIDRKTYFKIVDVVRERPDKSQLTLIFDKYNDGIYYLQNDGNNMNTVKLMKLDYISSTYWADSTRCWYNDS